MSPPQLSLAPRRIVHVLTVIVALLVISSVAVQAVRFATGDHRLYGLVYIFSLGAENNPAAYYSTFALLLSAALLAVIGSASVGNGTIGPQPWLVLAGVFVFLSVDEMVGIHERLIDPVRGLLDLSGSYYYAWVIPYGAVVLVLGAFYVRFLLKLPRGTASRFVLGGCIFLAGAIGLEMVGGAYAEAIGTQTVPYVAVQTLEEVFEMVGILIFIHALLEYIDRSLGGVHVHLSSARGTAASEPPVPQGALDMSARVRG